VGKGTSPTTKQQQPQPVIEREGLTLVLQMAAGK